MAQKNKNLAASVGAAVALSAAAVAGAYFLYGKGGAKNRKKVRGWALKLKGEVLDKMERLNDLNQSVYHKTIDQVASKYRGIKNVDSDELTATILDLKKHWNNISRQIETGSKKPAKKRATKK